MTIQNYQEVKMDEIKVGEYVRHKDGVIDKIFI